MRSQSRLVVRTVVVLAALLLLAPSARAAEVSWSYSGQITFTNFPDDFPLGAPVRLVVTVDPETQALVLATTTFNGYSYQVGPTFLAYVGEFNGGHQYYSSGYASGPTVGSFTPWLGTFFFTGGSGGPFTADPLLLAQSFVFEDAFGDAIGAKLTLDPPTPGELLSELAEQVSALDVNAGIASSLGSLLTAAMKVLADDESQNDVAAANMLVAFINQVEAHRSKALTDEQATALRGAAESIVMVLGG